MHGTGCRFDQSTMRNERDMNDGIRKTGECCICMEGKLGKKVRKKGISKICILHGVCFLFFDTFPSCGLHR